MTEADPDAKPAEQTPAPALSQMLVDLGPIAVFVVVYNVLNRMQVDGAIFWSTGVFIAATLAAIVWCKFKRGKVPPVLIVTGVLVTIFGGLTLALHDENFMKIKPTVVYVFYAAAIAGSVAIKQNVWKLLFQHAFTLPDRAWNVLALRWAAFFAALAVLNEIVRLKTSTDFWVNSRLMIFTPLVLGFALLNAPLVLKHQPRPDDAPPPDGTHAE